MNSLRDWLASAQTIALSGGYVIVVGLGCIALIAWLSGRM